MNAPCVEVTEGTLARGELTKCGRRSAGERGNCQGREEGKLSMALRLKMSQYVGKMQFQYVGHEDTYLHTHI